MIVMRVWKDQVKKPAIVKYIGTENNSEFSFGKEYQAFFLEYWQAKRNSLHVKGNSGEITDFNPFEDFEVVSDEDNLLNKNEAIVECVTHEFDGEIFELTYGKQYKALGMDRNGYYLVMDDSSDCYFYPSEFFEIKEDKYGLLSCCSLYYHYK